MSLVFSSNPPDQEDPLQKLNSLGNEKKIAAREDPAQLQTDVESSCNEEQPSSSEQIGSQGT